MPRLDGKAVVVTGGAGLLGAAFCRSLAEHGASVLINDVNAKAAEALATGIGQAGGTASPLIEPVDSWEGGRRVIEACVERYGRIDCLVNAAHRTIPKPIWELTEAEFDLTVDIHLKGHFACTSHAARHMMKQGSGSIINLASRAMAGLERFSAYGASKGGIISATFTWALELAPYGIRVNALSPAARPLQEGRQPSMRMPWRRRPGQTIEEMRDETPPPETVAPLVIYLASDASDWVSGQVLFLSGDSLAVVRHPMEERFAFLPHGWSVEDLERYFRDSLGPAFERPSMGGGPYRWYGGVGKDTRA